MTCHDMTSFWNQKLWNPVSAEWQAVCPGFCTCKMGITMLHSQEGPLALWMAATSPDLGTSASIIKTKTLLQMGGMG